MRVILFVSIVFLCALYHALAQGSYEDCCLSYVSEVRTIIKKRVWGYRLQEQDGGCNLHAVVFKLRSGRLLCANPVELWVKALQKDVDWKKKKNVHRRRTKSKQKNKDPKSNGKQA